MRFVTDKVASDIEPYLAAVRWRTSKAEITRVLLRVRVILSKTGENELRKFENNPRGIGLWDESR